MNIWKRFKFYFNLVCDFFPKKLLLLAAIVAFLVALIMTIVTIVVSVFRKKERHANREYNVKTQKVIEKQQAKIDILENDKKRREYRDSLFEAINNNEDEHEE